MSAKRYFGWVGTVGTEDKARDKYSALSSNYCEIEDVIKFPPDKKSLKIIKDILQLRGIDSGYDFTVVEELVYGKDLEPGPQNIGNCVGYSHCMCLASKIAHEIFVEKQPEEPLESQYFIPFIPYSYGAGRIYIGNNKLGRSDGSNCSWQIEASMNHGFLPCDADRLDGYDQKPQGTSGTGRLFGSNKSVLDTFHDQAIKFDLVDSTRVTTVDEVKTILTEVYSPIQICSNWGFKAFSYDNERKIWIYKQSGSWSHSMQLIGWLEIKGESFIHVRNQWGRSAHKDCTPVIPLGGFLIGVDTLSQWLPNAYAATIGEIKGKGKIFDFPF